MASQTTIKIDTGDTTISRGVFQAAEKLWLAMTFTQSKEFKTRAAAEKWLAKKTA